MLLQVVSLMAFMLALVFIFEIVNREVESITQPKEGIIGARDVESGPQSGEQAPNEQQGHNVALPAETTENGQPLSEVYAEVTGTHPPLPLMGFYQRCVMSPYIPPIPLG